MSGIKVITPGLLTTIQDLGRPGFRRFGVTVGGAVDRVALRTANLLVGNDEKEAALEMTMLGVTLFFESDTLVAVCGGEMTLEVEGADGLSVGASVGVGTTAEIGTGAGLSLRSEAGVGEAEPVGGQAMSWHGTIGRGQLSPAVTESVLMNRPVLVRGGSVLRCGRMRAGCRAYLAVAGGFALEPVLGSRSTDLRAGIGGLAGRALQAGDALALRPPSALATRIAVAIFAARGVAAGGDWAGRRVLAAPFAASLPSVPTLHTAWATQAAHSSAAAHAAHAVRPAAHAAQADLASPADPAPIRILRGDRFTDFDPPSQAALFAEPYAVSPQSDRMGCRLDGLPLRLASSRELLSEAVAPGAIQVPPDGRPIVLMADCQTTGGYPIIGYVIAADMPLMAQLPIGSRFYFHEVTMEEAQRAYVFMENEMKLLSHTIRARHP